MNGWRNVIYLRQRLARPGLRRRAASAGALPLGAFYLALGIWGLIETERGIGSILDVLRSATGTTLCTWPSAGSGSSRA